VKQQSLRQLANELDVSASYLSRVRNDKRPASIKVLSKHITLDTPLFTPYNYICDAGMAEQADAADLKSAGAILVGSSPSPGTTIPK
jgi:transcriptional regulator with XRE-family HTH domain